MLDPVRAPRAPASQPARTLGEGGDGVSPARDVECPPRRAAGSILALGPRPGGVTRRLEQVLRALYDGACGSPDRTAYRTTTSASPISSSRSRPARPPGSDLRRRDRARQTIDKYSRVTLGRPQATGWDRRQRSGPGAMADYSTTSSPRRPTSGSSSRSPWPGSASRSRRRSHRRGGRAGASGRRSLVAGLAALHGRRRRRRHRALLDRAALGQPGARPPLIRRVLDPGRRDRLEAAYRSAGR